MSMPGTVPPQALVGADEIEEALSAYFAPMRRSSAVWETDDALPFTLIQMIGGTEDPEVGFADPLVQVETLCDKSLGYINAKQEKQKTHQAMVYLARYQPRLVLNGRTFGVDYVQVTEMPNKKPFGVTTVIRYVGRYKIGLQYVPLGAP